MASRKRDHTAVVPAPPDLLVVGLAAAGFAIAGYLTWLKWSGGNAAFCLTGSGCDIVQASRYGALLSVPTAFWGALLYLAVGVLAALGFTGQRWAWAFYLAAAGVGVSLYLTAVSLIVLGVTCAYCLASSAVMVAILLVLLWRRARLPARRKLASVLTGAVAAAVLAPLGAAFIFAFPQGGGAGFEAALVRHLREKGAVMYGAYWCPHCTEQKALFGDAAKDIPYVECDPKGVNARPDLCQQAGVKSFPTWVMGDQRREGVQSPQALADFSKFEEPAKPSK